MNEENKKKISKFLSLILRHSPEIIKLELDENGWADVEELISKSAKHIQSFSFSDLEEVVATNDKQRFTFNTEKTKIRASQGHSVNIKLDLETKEPPELLFHGTVNKFITGIREKGLLKMNRQHIHLSIDKETASKVGSRRGLPVILIVKSGEMHRNKFDFYVSENGVWLTDHVPAKYIEF